MTTMVEESCHPIFTQDPAHWMQYIYKKVRVVTGPNQDQVGHVYTVDPVTFSFILVRFPTDPTTTTTTATNVAEAADSSTTTAAIDTSATTTTEAKPSGTSTTTTTTATSTTTAATTATTTTANKTSIQVYVIPGHAVVDVHVLQEDDDDDDNGGGHERIKARLDALFLNNNNNSNLICGGSSNLAHLSEDELSQRRDQLKSWLQKNRLPVQEQKVAKGEEEDGGDKGRRLCVAGAVTIVPPYGPSNCCSTNEIILSRIQTLIRNMPVTV